VGENLIIAIIICTKNRPRDFEITLDSIYKQIYKQNYIIIVDDSCDDETRDVVDEYSDIIYFHPIVPNSGLSAARNAGLEYVPNNTDIVLFLDDDVTLDKNYLKEMNKKFIRYPLADGMSGYLKDGYHTSPTWKKLIYAFIGFVLPPLVPVSIGSYHVTKTGGGTMPVFLDKHDPYKVEWLNGCDMAYRNSLFKYDGYRFDENLIGYSMGEDTLFSHKLYQSGKWFLISRESLIEHRCSEENRMPPFKKLIMTFAYRRYIIQNLTKNKMLASLYRFWFDLTFSISIFILCLIGKYEWKNLKNVSIARKYVSSEEDISKINKFIRGVE
jgi:glycosyltransferase involved in cell wall biosynthesis